MKRFFDNVERFKIDFFPKSSIEKKEFDTILKLIKTGKTLEAIESEVMRLDFENITWSCLGEYIKIRRKNQDLPVAYFKLREHCFNID